MPVAVITGASGGIGGATAKLFLDNGWTVYDLSRKGGADQGARFISTDITDNSAVKAAFDRIKDECGALDILVNNAGFGISGSIEFSEMEDIERQINVSFLGQVRCAKAALPLLRERCGRIINVSSVAALFAIPFQSFYSSAKSAVNAFSLALDNEIKRFGMRSIAIMPGDVKTGFTSARKKNEAGEEIYGKTVERSVAVMEKDEQNGMSPEVIARAIFKAATAKNPKPLSTVGAQYKFFAFLFKVLPTRLINFIVGMMYIKK